MNDNVTGRENGHDDGIDVDERTERALTEPFTVVTLGASAPGPWVATSDGGVLGGEVESDTDEPTVREAVEGAEILDESDDTEGDTSARDPNPLGEAIAEVAPYANNRFHNDR